MKDDFIGNQSSGTTSEAMLSLFEPIGTLAARRWSVEFRNHQKSSSGPSWQMDGHDNAV